MNYNFSTALSQASNQFKDPPQLKLVNGVWAMISGDINLDYAVDAADGAAFKVAFIAGKFDLYIPLDLNLDGTIDAMDGALFKSGFLGGYYSTLANF